MLSPLALTAVVDRGEPFVGGLGLGLVFFVLIPLFWLGIFLLVGGLARRRWARGGWGPGHSGARGGWGPGHFGGHGRGPFGAAAQGAESTLAERFAQGDIDEQEYRARLEVLRANNGPTPPSTA